MKTSPCSHSIRVAPSLSAQTCDSLKQPASIQLQNSTLTEVPILTDTSVPHSCTWKRIPRPNQEVAFPLVTHFSSKCPSSLLHDSNELPSKRRLVSQAESGSTFLLAEIDF